MNLHVFLRAGRDEAALLTDQSGRLSAEETHGEVAVSLHLLLTCTKGGVLGSCEEWGEVMGNITSSEENLGSTVN